MSSRPDWSVAAPSDRRRRARVLLRTHILAALGVAGCSQVPVPAKPTIDGLYDAIDKDGDGATALTDCNDADPSIHPDAAEQCNDVDDNCNGIIDEEVRSIYYRDADGDTFGSPTDIRPACEQPIGYVQNDDDCNDLSDAAFPGGEEVCDGVDNDCDGTTDDIPGFWPDRDGDGFGGDGDPLTICSPMPDGYADNQADCDDANERVNPGEPEHCFDAIDNNCDGLLSCMTVDVQIEDSDAWCSVTWAIEDAETDGYGVVPCVDCDFHFNADLELQEIAGDATLCSGADDLATEFDVQGVRMGGGIDSFASGGWFGYGAFDGDILTWYTEPNRISLSDGGYASLIYGGELMVFEVQEYDYYYGYYGYYEGRPLSVQGVHLAADEAERADWHRPDATVSAAELTPAERERAVAAWTRAGLAEHASVASFNRFVLELMSLGAPPDLLMESLQAASDEVVHARDCFSVASALAGRSIGPGPLPVDGVLDDVSIEGILSRLLAEGCVEETISTSLAAQRLSHATDPLIRSTLERIVADETRHAALAWRTARWILSSRPELVPLARQALTEAMAQPTSTRGEPVSAALKAHGVLSRADRARERERTLRDVVAPAVNALFASLEPTRSAVRV